MYVWSIWVRLYDTICIVNLTFILVSKIATKKFEDNFWKLARRSVAISLFDQIKLVSSTLIKVWIQVSIWMFISGSNFIPIHTIGRTVSVHASLDQRLSWTSIIWTSHLNDVVLSIQHEYQVIDMDVRYSLYLVVFFLWESQSW